MNDVPVRMPYFANALVERKATSSAVNLLAFEATEGMLRHVMLL